MTAFDFFNIICSIPKTLRFNFHYFPLKTALKLPVVVSHRTYLRELHGKVELPEKVGRAMIKIGFGDVGHYDRKRSRGIWQVSGMVSFGGKASIGHGSKLSIRGHLSLGADFNMTAESTIVCAKDIRFGDDCLLSWDILVMDTDEHPLYSCGHETGGREMRDDERINPDKAILVGDHVWVGCHCILLKGTEIPNNTVVAAGTLLTSSFSGNHQVIGGNPPTILKRDVRWEH
jgi:acetyltransferase-like isoleucine patch superfamily enzyme